MANTTKFIFVTGGVLSSLGKGLASAVIGSLLLATSQAPESPAAVPGLGLPTI